MVPATLEAELKNDARSFGWLGHAFFQECYSRPAEVFPSVDVRKGDLCLDFLSRV